MSTKSIHANYHKASTLIFGSAALGLPNFYFSKQLLISGQHIMIAIVAFLLIFGVGYLARQGKGWVKYLLLVLSILGILGLPVIINNILHQPLVGFINLTQTIMQIWALVLLFRVPKVEGGGA